MKELPIEVNIVECLVRMATSTNADEGQKAMADLALINFYYLLRVGNTRANESEIMRSRWFNSD